MRFILISFLFLSGCIVEEPDGCDTDVECKEDRVCEYGECVSDYSDGCNSDEDCSSNEICLNNLCVSDTENTKTCGEQVHGCTCVTTSFQPGQTVSSNVCDEDYAVYAYCSGCCAWDNLGNCLGVPWTKVCGC